MANKLAPVDEKIKLLEEEYTTFKKLKIYCGTFNVNGKLPDESLAPWLFTDSKHKIDIYAIGIQELVDLNTKNVVLSGDASDKESFWKNCVATELLNSNCLYKFAVDIRLVGLYLMIFINVNLYEEIRDLATSYVATGMMDIFGNKGSVGVSMRIHETRICFICSHFAADTDKMEKRNSDFRAARENLKFQDENRMSSFDVEDHDIIFWFGDLNYRLESLSYVETIKYITSSSFDELIKYDQLSNQRQKSRVFNNYNESPINFPPTYKYIIKSDHYENLSNLANLNISQNSNSSNNKVSKIKLPSWTDRVLWRALDGNRVTQTRYSCVNTITISDHKPVYALFDTGAKIIDETKYRKCYEKILKENDRKLNEEMPRVKIEISEFNFGECMYYDAFTNFMTIKNDGLTRSNVDILFYDRAKMDLAKIDEPTVNYRNLKNNLQWISIHPQHRERVDPGSTYIVELTTCFNCTLLKRLNKEKELLDFLVVRCLNGNDSFVTISCKYKPSIIGISLKCLSSLERSFDESNNNDLITIRESEIQLTEDVFDSFLNETVTNYQSQKQIENLEKLAGASSEKLNLKNNKNTKQQPVTINEPFIHFTVLDSRIDCYKRSLSVLKEKKLDFDKYFNIDLSDEYKFLMDYLIQRCKDNLLNGFDNSNANSSNLTTEEQKNLVLIYLSSRNYSDFEEKNFDLDILAEVLNDLLRALPQSLIPRRYLDFCAFTDNSYNEASKLLFYLPKSHLKLFELIVKFLQIYIQCLATCDTEYRSTLGEAIFQTDRNEHPKNFLKLFIDNHTIFHSID